MSDVQKLITDLLSDFKFSHSKSAAEKIYKDEPILTTAAQMSNFTPPKYRKMRMLSKAYNVYNDYKKIFYKQGKYMEDFEDDYQDQAVFASYFPTYQDMTDAQLRSYFSWRTKYRKGISAKAPEAFIYLYMYELINQIGVESAEKGFEKLKFLYDNHDEYCQNPNAGAKVTFERWLHDYIIYYDLDKSLLTSFENEASDNAILVLQDYQNRTKEEVLSALQLFSSHSVEKSRFYKQYAEDFKDVVYNVFVALDEYYRINKQGSVCDRLFGREYSAPYYIFSGAVFYEPKKHEDSVYELDSLCKYICEDGMWKCRKHHWKDEKNKTITAILKNIDSSMRIKYEFKHPLKDVKIAKAIQNIILTEIDNYLQNKFRKAKPVVEIDVSKLQEIRDNSLKTQSKLIVPESDFAEFENADAEDAGFEPEDVVTGHEKLSSGNAEFEMEIAVSPIEEESALEITSFEQKDGGDETFVGLGELETDFLKCLLENKPFAELLRSKRIMSSILIDEINEKMFDVFSDNVIDFDGENPILIEDYVEELKGIIGA